MVMTFLFCFVTFAAAVYTCFEGSVVIGYWTGARRARRARARAIVAASPAPPPDVTVQLPLYNEGAVACGLIEAVCAFDYPRDRLHIQVLDDSTDETPAILAPLIARMKAKGIDILHLRRPHRDGFKAGALAQGLLQSSSPFVAIFDADFRPPADFLKQALVDGTAFDDPRVAFLQGRWTHLNEFQNTLTRAQAFLLDRHFIVQKPFQLHRHATTSFNGSAGIWRRAAIDSVGGWSADTLSEDMDLSYRCALSGWTSAYDEHLTCPAEIPPSMLSFKLQQRRWAKGSAQCLRKLFTLVARSPRLENRAQDLYYIGGYLIHPILLCYALLWPLAVLSDLPWQLLYAGQACLIGGTIVAISGYVTTMMETNRLSLSSCRDIGIAFVLGMSLMVNNTIAFLLGWLQTSSVFERTPKQGRDASRQTAPLREALHWGIHLEIVVIVYMTLLSAVLVRKGHLFEAIPSIEFALCLAIMVACQIFERYRARQGCADEGRRADSVEQASA